MAWHRTHHHRLPARAQRSLEGIAPSPSEAQAASSISPRQRAQGAPRRRFCAVAFCSSCAVAFALLCPVAFRSSRAVALAPLLCPVAFCSSCHVAFCSSCAVALPRCFAPSFLLLPFPARPLLLLLHHRPIALAVASPALLLLHPTGFSAPAFALAFRPALAVPGKRSEPHQVDPGHQVSPPRWPASPGHRGQRLCRQRPCRLTSASWPTRLCPTRPRRRPALPCQPGRPGQLYQAVPPRSGCGCFKSF